MKKDKNVLLIGLGVDDPKGIFGTTKGLNKFLKENKFLISDCRKCDDWYSYWSFNFRQKTNNSHKVEFSLLIEQIINQAAKWFFGVGDK